MIVKICGSSLTHKRTQRQSRGGCKYVKSLIQREASMALNPQFANSRWKEHISLQESLHRVVKMFEIFYSRGEIARIFCIKCIGFVWNLHGVIPVKTLVLKCPNGSGQLLAICFFLQRCCFRLLVPSLRKQPSFTRNATRAGSKEGRLFSQAQISNIPDCQEM